MQAALAKVREAPPPGVAGAGTQAAMPPAAAVPPGSALDQVKLLIAQKRLPEAIAGLNAILTSDPRNEPALRLRTIMMLGLNRVADAHKDVDELVELKPNDGSALALRALVEIRSSQPELAKADLNRAISLDPNNALAYFGRGSINQAEGKFKDALIDLDRSIAIDAKDSAAFAERGQTYMGLNQLEKALADYDQAIVLNPLNDTARAARGLALLAKGNSAEGLLDIKNALDRNPNNQIALVGQGLAMLVSGQYDRSIVALNQLVGKPGDTLARLLRARAYLGQKNADDAMADLNAVLGRQPANPEGLLLRGIAWSAKHDYAKALDDLSAAIAQRESVEGYFARAKAYEAQNIPGKAEKDYERATELRPTSVFDLLAQAESKQKVKQLSKQLPCGNAQAAVNAACL
jgi:tetratricopeptide (TPR) repeat protein